MQQLTPSQRTRVLVLEDDAPIAELMSIVLELEGYEVSKAASASEAMRQLEQAPPDALILDLALPDVDGVRFLRALRAQPAWQMLPVIVVSAYPYLADGEAVSATFTKPPDVTELLAAIASATKPQSLSGAT